MIKQGLIFLVLLAVLPTVGPAAERWERLPLPSSIADATVTGMGEIQFPDGRTSAWIGTDAGLYRRSEAGWNAWMPGGEELRSVATVAFGPGPDGQTSWWIGGHEGLAVFSPEQGLSRLGEEIMPLIDQPINALIFDQARGAGADLWIGGDAGLLIGQQGRWMPVSARPDGFPGGRVQQFRRLVMEDQRERWVVSSEGLGRYVGGQWSRPGAECLRGRQVLGAETVEFQGVLHLAIATARGPFVLEISDNPACRPIDLAGLFDEPPPTRALLRDDQGRLYLFHDEGVARWHLDRNQVGEWTAFDARDGLEHGIEWTGPARRDSDGSIWAGSTAGVWQMRPQTRAGSAAPTVMATLDGLALQPGDNPIGLLTRSGQIEISTSDSARPHAVRFSLTGTDTPNGERSPSWQSGRLEQFVTMGLGDVVLRVDLVDAWGVPHGPIEYRLVRSPILPWVVLVLALGLTLMAMGWLVRRNR